MKPFRENVFRYPKGQPRIVVVVVVLLLLLLVMRIVIVIGLAIVTIVRRIIVKVVIEHSKNRNHGIRITARSAEASCAWTYSISPGPIFYCGFAQGTQGCDMEISRDFHKWGGHILDPKKLYSLSQKVVVNFRKTTKRHRRYRSVAGNFYNNAGLQAGDSKSMSRESPIDLCSCAFAGSSAYGVLQVNRAHRVILNCHRARLIANVGS